MFQVYCYRCSQYSNSPDGVCCPQCGDVKTVMTSFPEDFQPAVSDSVNVNPGYSVPAPDASSPMTDDDFLQPTQGASTISIDRYHGYADYSQIRASQISDQCAAANRNLLPENPNINKDNYITNIGRCNHSSIGFSLASETDSDVVPEQWTHLEEQPTHNERQYVDEDGKLDFAGAINFPSEYSIPNSNPESSVNVNSSFIQARENSDRFPGNVATTKSDLEHEVHNSGKARRNVSKPKMLVEQSLRCEKCGKSFPSEWDCKVHVANKCYPDSYKCNECGRTFRIKSCLLKHLPAHNEEKPYECGKCGFATNWKRSLRGHIKTYHK